ncbi:MAG: S8 family serine peptidase [Geminicoccaceae bacterium]
MTSARIYWGLLSCSIVISGCGGGGGNGGGNGGGSTRPTTPQATASDYRTEEYLRMGGHDIISLADGYAIQTTGRPGGAGTKIGIVDIGISPHPDLDVVGNYTWGGLPPGDPGNHGTLVAGVAAARKNDEGVHGVAYNAGLVNFRISPSNYSASNELDDDAVIAAAIASGAGVDATYSYRYVAGKSASSNPAGEVDVINMSFTTADFEGNIRDAMRKAAAAGKIMTVALGNEGHATPLWAPAVYVGEQGIAGAAVAVGALDSAGNERARFSNMCGDVRKYCLFAPGSNLVSTSSSGRYTHSNSGTSFAAPYVAGAAAVLLAAFPGRSGKQVVERMLSTADDLGTPGVDGIYGHGRLNMEKALNPVGSTSVALDNSTAGRATSLAGMAVDLPAWADASGLAASLNDVLIHDSQLFPFKADLSHSVRTADNPARIDSFLLSSDVRTVQVEAGDMLSLAFAHEPAAGPEGLTRRFDELDDGGRVESYEVALALGEGSKVTFARGYGVMSDAPEHAVRQLAGGDMGPFGEALSPFSSLASAQEGLRFDTELDDSTRIGMAFARGGMRGSDGDSRIGSLTLSHDLGDGVQISSTVGVMDESETALGGSLGGAAGGVDGRTSFVNLVAMAAVSDTFSMFGSLTSGWTDSGISQPGLVRGLDMGRSDAYAVGFSWRELAGADQLAVSLSQPLRPDEVTMNLDLPGHEAGSGGPISRERSRVDISPDGRERNLQMIYRKAFDEEQRVTMAVGAFARFQPNHDADAATELGGGVRVGYGF